MNVTKILHEVDPGLEKNPYSGTLHFTSSQLSALASLAKEYRGASNFILLNELHKQPMRDPDAHLMLFNLSEGNELVDILRLELNWLQNKQVNDPQLPLEERLRFLEELPRVLNHNRDGDKITMAVNVVSEKGMSIALYRGATELGEDDNLYQTMHGILGIGSAAPLSLNAVLLRGSFPLAA